MTFLQLVQTAQQETGSSGSAGTTVIGATGEWKRLCDWVSRAFIELQMKRDDWEWLEGDVVFDTVANQQAYPVTTTTFSTPNTVGLADFRAWKLSSTSGDSSFRLYLKSSGVTNETFLDGSLSYAQFRDAYIFGSRRTTPARPIAIAVQPDKSLLLGLTPNDIYTVNGRYYKNPYQLSLDADVPALPAQYHMLIVYLALIKYAFYESAPEVLEYAKTMAKPLMYSLEDAQLPELQLGDPLV